MGDTDMVDAAAAPGPDPAPRRSSDAQSKPVEAGSEAQLVQAKADLNEEIQARMEAERKLKEMSDKLESLQRQQSQDVAEKEQFRKSWKKAAVEIDKLRNTGQGFYKLTDEYLVELILQLRYSIRDFSIQYFDGNPQEALIKERRGWLELLGSLSPDTTYHPYSSSKSTGRPESANAEQDSFEKYLRRKYQSCLENTTPDKTCYQHYLKQPDKCHKVIQAFLWEVLVREVFDMFRWMSDKNSNRVWHLRRLLAPKNQNTPAGKDRPDPEAERKFQMWSATTTGLILDVADAEKDPEALAALEGFKTDSVGAIKDTIIHWSKPDNRGFEEQLHMILDKALVLDQEISRQVARVVWVFDWDHSAKNAFDPATMELEKGDKVPRKDAEVRFVVAPGVVKRGKSAGDGFKKETSLLKVTVSCD